MVKQHLKRLPAPSSWPILRKVNKFVARPRPGAHAFSLGLPTSVVLKYLIDDVTTTKEVKRILQNNEVLVDGSKILDHRRIIGFMDVISFPSIKKNYRMSLNRKGKIEAFEVPQNEASSKLVKIIGKTLVKGKTQLNMLDGRNILVDKDDYKRGDVLLIDVPSQKIKQKVSLDKSSKVFLLGGKHTGEIETVEDITGKKITLRTKEGEVFETLRKYAFAVGKDKEIIKITK